MAKIIKNWQTGNKEAGEVVYDYYLVQGIKSLMKSRPEARAIFGWFEVVEGGLVVWSAFNGDRGQYDDTVMDGEYLDDLKALRNGRVEYQGA